MSTYRGILGFRNQSFVTDDPSISAGIEGQVWYNITSNVAKVAVATPTSWTSVASMNTSKQYNAGAGTATSALAFGGNPTGATEKYDGTSWTSVNNMNTVRRQLAGAGTQTSALAFGGATMTPTPTQSAATEKYDGTNWTSVNNMVLARDSLAGCGTQTSALAFGGKSNTPEPAVGNTEKYNGTTWTASPALNTVRLGLAGAGTQTSALGFGGNPESTEKFSGLSWATGNNMNTARYYLAGCGTQTATLAFGGFPIGTPSPLPIPSATELYNGTTWTTNSISMNSGRPDLAAAGNQTTALAFGGQNATTTEKWDINGTSYVSKTITTA